MHDVLQASKETPTDLTSADEYEKCGHIFFHKQSMLLKYFCLFCGKAFDNIHHYCEHLSEHVFEITNRNELDDHIKENETSISSLLGNESQKDSYEGQPIVYNNPNDKGLSENPQVVHELILFETSVSKKRNEEDESMDNSSNGTLSKAPQKQSLHENENATHVIGDTIITSLPSKQVKESHKKDNLTVIKFSCNSCKHSFPNLMCLKEHRCQNTSLGRTTISQKCPDCNELFIDISDMNNHILKVHHGDEIICRFCGRSDFDSNEVLLEHISVKHNDHEEIFKCYICGRRYYLEANLLPHVWRHAKREPQCCVVCGKMTLRIQHHMKFKHSPKPTRLLQCSICNKTFSYTSSLSRHKLLHKLPRTDMAKTIRKDNATKKRRKIDKWNKSNCRINLSLDSVVVETQAAVENIL